jgi:hypothetical protein
MLNGPKQRINFKRFIHPTLTFLWHIDAAASLTYEWEIRREIKSRSARRRRWRRQRSPLLQQRRTLHHRGQALLLLPLRDRHPRRQGGASAPAASTRRVLLLLTRRPRPRGVRAQERRVAPVAVQHPAVGRRVGGVVHGDGEPLRRLLRRCRREGRRGGATDGHAVPSSASASPWSPVSGGEGRRGGAGDAARLGELRARVGGRPAAIPRTRARARRLAAVAFRH